MDDDDLRRGKPTVHKAFDEATAVLAGDSLHALAFEILPMPATQPDPFVRAELVQALAAASGPSGMAGGQMMDLEAEQQSFDLPTVTRLQQLKTGALIGAAVEMGAILGRVPRRAGRTCAAMPATSASPSRSPTTCSMRGRRGQGRQGAAQGRGAGKATFVSLLGVDGRATRRRCWSNRRSGILRSYGAEADLLRALARFIVERDQMSGRASASIPAPSIRSRSAIWTSSGAAPSWSTG